MSRRRRRQRHRGSAWGKLRTLLLLSSAFALIGLVGVFASFGYSYTQLSAQMPELENYAAGELAQTSIVYDAEDNVVDELFETQNRFVVDINGINPTLQNAVVAIEDHRFYQHRGMDFEAIGRAAAENVENMSIEQGGSTITQQLMKNTFIPQEQRTLPSFQRKITEAALAWQYEEEHSKEEILEQYLNTVYFGMNAYGAEAAARTYFDKNASELTLAESALLAGIINLPGAYDPFNDPESARARRDVVLDSMLQYGYINQDEHAEAVAQDLNLNRGRVEYENDNEYFLEAVRKELAEEFPDEVVYGDGLKIYTTLDPRLQEMANEAVDTVVNPDAGDPSASLVSSDPTTGAVRAMVGGSDFQEVKFNLATQGQRQSGSTFKAFVLAEAINQGIDPRTRYQSRPLRIPMPDDAAEPFYEVANYEDEYRGVIDLEEATVGSDNAVFVQLAQDLGMDDVVDMAQDLGIESELDAYLPTAIGGLREGVTPLEMASAYSTFANQGVNMQPYLVERVVQEQEDGDEVVLFEHEPEGERALSRDEAAAVTEVLEEVGDYYNLDDDLGRTSAGKTGTSERFSDAWYVGYVPQLTTSVWVGYPGERRPMVNINGLEEINGGNYPLDIWRQYMQGAIQQFPEQEFDRPSPELDLRIKYSGNAYGSPSSRNRGGSTGDGSTTGGSTTGGVTTGGVTTGGGTTGTTPGAAGSSSPQQPQQPSFGSEQPGSSPPAGSSPGSSSEPPGTFGESQQQPGSSEEFSQPQPVQPSTQQPSQPSVQPSQPVQPVQPSQPAQPAPEPQTPQDPSSPEVTPGQQDPGDIVDDFFSDDPPSDD